MLQMNENKYLRRIISTDPGDLQSCAKQRLSWMDSLEVDLKGL